MPVTLRCSLISSPEIVTHDKSGVGGGAGERACMNFGQLAGNADELPSSFFRRAAAPPPNDFLLKLKMKVLEEEEM